MIGKKRANRICKPDLPSFLSIQYPVRLPVPSSIQAWKRRELNQVIKEQGPDAINYPKLGGT